MPAPPRRFALVGAAASAALLPALAACITTRPASPAVTAPIAMPGPAPERPAASALPRPAIVAANDACERCHPIIADEWRASLHRSAHTDPVYQRALAIEPLPFCRGCHAPEADPRADPPGPLGALGVGCVSCHLVAGTVLAAPRATASAPAPHLITRDARFADAGACAGCHEFAFPDAALRKTPTLMQSTITEHRRSPAATAACASCHMPIVRGHRSHAFTGSRDPAFVQSAARITATRTGPSAVRITLDPAGAGHALPTGDLFRRLEIQAEAEGPDHLVAASAVRYLTRHFRDERLPLGALVRVVARDDRPLAGPASVDLELDRAPAAASLPIAWRVTYQRVEHPRSDRADDALVEGEIVLASGLLAPFAAPAPSPRAAPSPPPPGRDHP